MQIELAVGPLYAALRQAAIVANDESRGIDFAFAEGSLVLSGSTAEIGQSRVEMPVGYAGPPLTVSLDHRFVADFLKVLDAGEDIHVRHGEHRLSRPDDDGRWIWVCRDAAGTRSMMARDDQEGSHHASTRG